MRSAHLSGVDGFRRLLMHDNLSIECVSFMVVLRKDVARFCVCSFVVFCGADTNAINTKTHYLQWVAFCTQLAHRALRRTSSLVSYAHTAHNTHSIYAEKVMIASNAGGMPNLDALIKINVNENNCHIWTIFVLNSMFPGRVIHLCNVHIYTQKPAIRNIGIFSIRLNLVLHFVFTFSIIMQHTTVTQTHIHYETMS